jgi:glutathione synthase/RimK-type ligase-like ATP-grasp enzyme
MDKFNLEVLGFIEAANRHRLRMLLVGGSAVNYYGYKQHSTNVDFLD